MATTAIFLTIACLTYFTTILIITHASTTTNNEIQALTTFKLNLLDPLNSLTTWNTSTPSPPCDWHGILCSNNRVHQIRLPRLQLSGTISSSLSKLTQLRKLSLHSNNLISSIPPSLSQCLFLRAIYLHNNSLSGNIPPSLLNLTNLQVLNFAANFLSGTIPNRLSNSLRILDLSSNSFTGNIPGNFTSNSQLQLINLSHNRLTGQIPVTLGALQQLQYMWLDNNRLHGTLPSAISNCSSMVHLSIDENSIGGLIPSTIGTMPKLQVLSLSLNQLSGFVPTTLFCNQNNKHNNTLRILQLGFNMLTGISNPRNGKCDNHFLEILDLKENHIIQSLFPSWLTNVKSLRTLDLSGNSFSGYLPRDIGDLFLLEELRLSDNSLSGVVPSSIVECSLLKVLDLRRNRFSGLVPYFVGELKSLKELSLGGNFFTGLIPKSYGGLYELEILDLSNNKLNGVLPLEIMQLGNLGVLNLSNNRFSGQVSYRIGGLKSLQVLNLSQCGFSGSVPSTLGSLMKLRVLDLSKQNLSGEIPVEVFGLPSLEVVALDGNSLSGSVPEGFSSIVSLRYLNISFNDFVGNIPTTYGFLSSLVVLSLSHNFISGSIPNEIGGCSQLEVLQLQSNRLVGNIVPSVISHLTRLKELSLGNNGLKGEIPDEISKCSSLNSLDLNGEIPVDLWRISGLKYLNVSNNDLEGEIPQMLSSRFNDPSVFAMNKRLCGKPLHRDCAKARRRKRKRLIIIIGVAVAGLCFLALFCCGYVYSLLRWRKKLREGVTGEKKRSSTSAGSNGERNSRGSGENGGPKLIVFNNKITYAETLEATRNFDEENVLSRGKHGLVFKASYQDGMVLSIRRLPNGSTLIEENTFRKEAESLGKVKHRNLTVLRGYYAGPPPDVRLLVYDYMPNGNLGTLLQEASQQDGHVLNWPMRHLIALGIARGLGFLHSVEIVHGDVKPQNVLFDADFEAHLSEFGLDRLTMVSIPTELAESSSSTTIAVGSLGYVAPEAVLTGQVTKEGDIYSFGIVLLEILTGRKAVMFTGQDEDIVKWVKKQLQKGLISELLEPGLLEIDQESSEWEEFLLGVKVALLCTAHDPLDRPSINDIVFMLEGCRVGPDIPSSADPTTLPSPVS
ncbi:hypothetical protein RYX36_012880 [Vicia faba]